MKTKILLLSAGIIISSTLVAAAQSAGQDPDDSWRHSRAAQEQLYKDRIEKEQFHSLLPKHLNDMNYSSGANSFPNAGLPGLPPGSVPMYF
jgi:hypothetical protein